MHQRVLDLAREEEDLLAEIASLKQKIPGRVAAAYSETLRGGLNADEAALEERAREVCSEAGTSVGEAGKGVLDVENAVKAKGGEGGDVEEVWKGLVEGLERLKREMPAAVAKMERARVAGEYVITQGR